MDCGADHCTRLPAAEATIQTAETDECSPQSGSYRVPNLSRRRRRKRRLVTGASRSLWCESPNRVASRRRKRRAARSAEINRKFIFIRSPSCVIIIISSRLAGALFAAHNAWRRAKSAHTSVVLQSASVCVCVCVGRRDASCDHFGALVAPARPPRSLRLLLSHNWRAPIGQSEQRAVASNASS